MEKTLTIGLSTYDDYDGVFFTVQALRMYHPICNTENVEFIILDNNPDSDHGKETKNFVVNNGFTYIRNEGRQSSFNKYDINQFSSGKYVLILDCHVLLYPGAIDSLLRYYKNNKECKNLIQGPLIYDNVKSVSTEFKPEWRGHMYGTWHTNQEAYEKGDPFEIQMQGMGLLSYEKRHWPGISEDFVGFGAEEGYIAEKFRRNGGKNICLPSLKWMHRFGRPNGVKYRLILEDRIWNYFIGWLDATDDENHEVIVGATEHFSSIIKKSTVIEILQQAKHKHLERKNANSFTK